MPGQFGPDKTRRLVRHGPLDLHHVVDRDPFSNADHDLKPGIHPFQNGVSGESGRNEDRGSRGAGLFYCLCDRVEDRHPVFKELAAFTGRDAGDDLGAVIKAELRVTRAEAAGDSLNDQFGIGFDENGHGLTEELEQMHPRAASRVHVTAFPRRRRPSGPHRPSNPL